MLVVSYKTKGKATKEAIKACDSGANAMRGLLMATAKVMGMPWYGRAMMWVMASVKRRVITDEEVRYEFFLIPNMPTEGVKNAVQPVDKPRS